MQVLSPALPLFWHKSDTRMRAMLARHFGALRKALISLEQCYREMLHPTTPPTCPAPEVCFPYSYSYTPIGKSSAHQFTYVFHMDADKLLFAARTTEGENICVKFVRHYSKDAHQLCASGDFAPALKGFESLPGGWYMVI